MKHAVFTNWKTTVFGILTGLTVVLTQIVTYFDGDPSTEPNWNAVAVGIMVALGLAVSKDHDL